jgi:hypothetical protein
MRYEKDMKTYIKEIEMLHILSDVLMIATRQDRLNPRRAPHRPNPQHEEHRRKAWSLITGLRL